MNTQHWVHVTETTGKRYTFRMYEDYDQTCLKALRYAEMSDVIDVDIATDEPEKYEIKVNGKLTSRYHNLKSIDFFN